MLPKVGFLLKLSASRWLSFAYCSKKAGNVEQNLAGSYREFFHFRMNPQISQVTTFKHVAMSSRYDGIFLKVNYPDHPTVDNDGISSDL